MSGKSACVGLVVAALFVPSVGRSQSIGGGIVGRVLDQRGAPVEAALVQIVNTSTRQIRSVSTDKEGRYEAPEVSPGNYELTVLKGGFNTAKRTGLDLTVTQVAHLADITLAVSPVGSETVEAKPAETAMTERNTPALSSAFTEKQIRELPLESRDVNNLALLAPGVSSVRTFSFANTLVPFAASGSRGRENNFIIDSVDNNEPFFGGVATQFTNTDLFSEYRIITNQYKAEFGRNSGSVVNMITKRGGNSWHGTGFWFAQRDALNATNQSERLAAQKHPAPYQGDTFGATLGGPVKRDSTWFLISYQWDRARNDMTALYPQVATLPTVNGLNTLSQQPLTRTLNALLNDPTVSQLPTASARCFNFIRGLPPLNPCTVGSVDLGNGSAAEFGSYLVPGAGVFYARDHQASVRIDHKLTPRDDVSGRYLVDDLMTPRTAGSAPIEVGFFDAGLLPSYRNFLAQRTQNAGIFWTHAWPRALHELRFSSTRLSAQFGALGISESARETLPSVTVQDNFAVNPAPEGTPTATSDFLGAFNAAGQAFTLGRDSRPAKSNTTLVQVQDNLSLTRGRHRLKFGANFVRTLSHIRDNASDLGQYFYVTPGPPQPPTPPGFQAFLANTPLFAFQQFPDFGGIAGPVLPLRQFGHFYFFEDDLRIASNFTVNLGVRYENYGQPINRIAELNPSFGPRIRPDNKDFSPRVGFALGLGQRTVLRGGYGIYYNPTAQNIALLAWTSGPISPLLIGGTSNVYPQRPFNPQDVIQHVTDCESLAITTAPNTPTFASCTAQDAIAPNLVQPRAQNFSLGFERQLGSDLLVELGYAGSIGTRLFQRVDSNPHAGWRIESPCPTLPCNTYLPRLNPNRGPITTVNNAARANYHSLQFSATKRFNQPGLFQGLALTAAYTWSHLIDTASEIFGPEVRRVRDFRLLRQNGAPIEVITPFAQNPLDIGRGERGNSSFDRRYRAALSFLWALPWASERGWRPLFGGWELSGIFTAQSGQPFSAINSFGACTDAAGEGILTNDRPSIGNPSAPLNRIALVADPNCISTAPSPLSRTGYVDTTGAAIDPATAHFVQVPLGVKPGTVFQAGRVPLVAGNAGRNILLGPRVANLDLALIKNFKARERVTLQLRFEGFNVLNKRNPGSSVANPFIAEAQAVPALAFGLIGPQTTPARATGVIPENTLDAVDPTNNSSLFLSRRFMNTSSRRLQSSLKILF